MLEKFRKTDKEYILSDSSVNEYGFRLLTSGYQLEAFQKNPIGYYMHRREDGVVLKWEDLRMEDDKIWGSPVINLSNERGQQTCDEVENGFLNAASVGHIVVLEYSTDPAMMLPGQTGPTITKWYNKECSLVDIPGNCNALTQLYDAQENEIRLADFSNQLLIKDIIKQDIATAICEELNLGAADDATVLAAIKELGMKIAKAEQVEAENKLLLNDKTLLQQELQELKTRHAKYEISSLLDAAMEGRKITRELRDKLSADYADNSEGLRSLLHAMPAYISIVENLRNAEREKIQMQWSWDDFEEQDPSGKKLKELKANNPERYKEIFKDKFEAELKS